MSDTSNKGDAVDDISFSWGKKRGRGGPNKDVQFYESFTYDGVEYNLFDCVYLFKKGEAQPYIGKIIKIWENPQKSRMVKILWFFYPSEIQNYLEGVDVLKNELFLASGEGKGLSNSNRLEAIAGKCDVICISRDKRNLAPSDEEINKADYVFYRTFDVGSLTISDELAEKIASTEVRLLLNQKGSKISDLSPSNVVDDGKVVAGVEKPVVASAVTTTEDDAMGADANKGSLSVNKEAGGILEKSKCPPAALLAPTVVHVSGDKNRLRSPDSKQDDVDKGINSSGGDETNNINISFSSVSAAVKEKLLDTKQDTVGTIIKSSSNAGPSGHRPSKLDGLAMMEGKTKNSSQKDTGGSGTHQVKNSVIAAEKGKSELTRNGDQKIGGLGKVNPVNSRGSVEEIPSKKSKLDSNAISIKASGADDNKTSEPSTTIITTKSAFEKESDRQNNDGEKVKSTNSHVTVKGTPIDAGVITPNNDKINKKSAANSPFTYKRFRPNGGAIGESNGGSESRKSLVCDESVVSKKLKPQGFMENSSKKLSEGSLKKSEEVSLKKSEEVEVVAYGHVKEVTPRPLDTGKAKSYLDWKERAKSAAKRGTLILLLNLDPSYTSSEVEDIIWHGLKENCTAKMVQQTATSSPHSGQAFVIFSNREVAERVISKLNEECLMLPNKRPLVAISWTASFGEDQSVFPGSLVIDKLKPQFQREAKAVSTSHPSQSNTLEYEMALEWLLMQARAEDWWTKLFKLQDNDLKKLQSNLKWNVLPNKNS